MTIQDIPRPRTGRECVIGPYSFPTKKAATEQIRTVLHSSELEQPLVGEALTLIRSLLSLHHEAEMKIGSGVRSIEVRIIEFGSRGFWITRTDGTMTDFSYRTAMSGAPTPKANVQAALRWEIQHQIEAFRDDAFKDGMIRCPLTGQVMTRGMANVDHAEPTFAEMAENFAAVTGGWSALEVECEEGPGCRRLLRDRELGETWRRYHQQVARLRVVHRDANIARHKAGA